MKLIFSDYSGKNGEIVKIACQGHIDKYLFIKRASVLYGKRLTKVKHCCRVFNGISPKISGGKVVGGFNTYLEFDSTVKGGEPVTIGYF